MDVPVLMAVCTHRRERVSEGCTVFYCADAEESQRVALLLARITRSAVHDLENDCLVVIRHP